jgi:hypothetical protein
MEKAMDFFTLFSKGVFELATSTRVVSHAATTRPDLDSQQLEIRFGMQSNQYQSPAQAGNQHFVQEAAWP